MNQLLSTDVADYYRHLNGFFHVHTVTPRGVSCNSYTESLVEDVIQRKGGCPGLWTCYRN